MAIIRKIIGGILLLALAAVFFVSGWSKLQTIQPFSWSFLDILPIGITTAGFVARIFIGLEWMIGCWLVAHIFLRRFTYRATIFLLLLFSLYLGMLLVKQGNTGNCGCFGEWLYMRPAAAIWKNVLMIAVVALLWFIYPGGMYPRQALVGLVLAAAAFTTPFLIEPLRIHVAGKPLHRPINLDPLFQYGNPRPPDSLRQGKHILCYFSTTCPHCKKGAYLVQILHRRYPEFPLFMVLNGTESLERSFFSETKSEAVPHTLMTNSAAFGIMAGKYVPVIYWVRDGIIEHETYFTELEPGMIRQWLKQ